MRDLIATLERDHFIDKEKIEGHNTIVKALNEDLKRISSDNGNLQR